MTEQTKTHWLQNPNKNYLGHWDLPEGRDVILTIKSAQWEEVKNPIINTSEAKRVIRFEEPKIKPFICNETNSQSILRSTKQAYMEDCQGLKIKLYLSQVNVKGEKVDCLRIREIAQSEMQPKHVTEEQRKEILELIEKSVKTAQEICEIMNVGSIAEIPLVKYNKLVQRLKELEKKDGNN